MSKPKKLQISMTEKEQSLCALYLALQLFVLPGLLNRLNAMLPQSLTDAKLNFLFFCLNFCCVVLFCRRFLRSSLTHSLRNFWHFAKGLVLGFGLYGLSSFAFAWLTDQFFPWFSNVNDASVAQMYRQEPELMTIGTVLLVPITEELLYRGLLFQGLHRRSRKAAYVISVTVFCMIHVAGYVGKYDLFTLTLCLVQYIMPSVILAWSYEQADSIFAPILIHTTINAMGIYAVR